MPTTSFLFYKGVFMKHVLYTLALTLLILFITSCEQESVVGGDSNVDTIKGSLDTSNVGGNKLVTASNMDLFLAELFSTISPKGGLETFYDLKYGALREQWDTVTIDTTILFDTILTGATGTIEYWANGEITKNTISNDDEYQERESSTVEAIQTFHNYSLDQGLFFGGEVHNKEVLSASDHSSSVLAFWTEEKSETCSLNIRFNGTYEGALTGNITYYIKENSDVVIDSSIISDLTVTSGNTIIALEKEDLEKYLD